jgi:hypothetical protein
MLFSVDLVESASHPPLTATNVPVTTPTRHMPLLIDKQASMAKNGFRIRTAAPTGLQNRTLYERMYSWLQHEVSG